MRRRDFLGRVAVGGTAFALGRAPRAWSAQRRPAQRERDTWLLFDLWHVSRMQNMTLRQGEPVWRPEGTYTDELGIGLASWCTVEPPNKGNGNKWRMFYSPEWKPFTLCIAQSDDGVKWTPADHADVEPGPGSKKQTPHHVYGLLGGSAGGVYIDPVADDGFRYKVYCHQQKEPVYQRALEDPSHPWHAAAKEQGEPKVWMMDELTAVSKDGVHWQTRHDLRWGRRDWHPEPPLFGYYHAETGRHVMTVRPGWGDRRVCIQSTRDFQKWSGPQMLFRPADPVDSRAIAEGGLIEHYGMPVFPYEGHYVGLLWIFHPQASAPTRGYNRFVGKMDCQLAYSYDGERFSRGLREPLIGVNPPGEHGCGGVEPSSIVVVDDQIRIYSASSRYQHGTHAKFRDLPKAQRGAILLHTLRKDGFMYLTPKGGVGRLTTKPLVLFDEQVTLNVEAPYGELRVGFVTWHNEPIEGFTLEDAVPMRRGDNTTWPVRFQSDRTLKELVNRPVRMVVEMRDARLYAMRGDMHWLDAHDTQMLDDGRQIAGELFDH